jgi:hypothetical protein
MLWIKARLYKLAEKPIFLYGRQAVRNCLAMNPALAAEGLISSLSRLFPQPI